MENLLSTLCAVSRERSAGEAEGGQAEQNQQDMFYVTHGFSVKHLTVRRNTSRIYGMRKTLKIEEPPVNAPVAREETVKKIAAQLAEWASMSETEPKADEQHAG